MVIGHFEIRTYQVTDTEEVFSFGVYLAARQPFYDCGNYHLYLAISGIELRVGVL